MRQNLVKNLVFLLHSWKYLYFTYLTLSVYVRLMSSGGKRED